MFIEPTSMDGLYTIDPERHVDDRGYFARAWCVNELSEEGLAAGFVQGSISYNTAANTLRGMHFQSEPWGETKLIRCETGAIYDVILDMRPDSDTYLQWEAFELDPVNGRQLYVSAGLAHGFLTLVDDTVVGYQIDTFYQPGHATGVRWDDPAFGITWPEVVGEDGAPLPRIMSDKDRSWPDHTA